MVAGHVGIDLSVVCALRVCARVVCASVCVHLCVCAYVLHVCIRMLVYICTLP